MRVFISGIVSNVDKAVAVFTAYSDYDVTEIDRYYCHDVKEPISDCAFVVSVIDIDDVELPFQSISDSAVEEICVLTKCNFLTTMF